MLNKELICGNPNITNYEFVHNFLMQTSILWYLVISIVGTFVLILIIAGIKGTFTGKNSGEKIGNLLLIVGMPYLILMFAIFLLIYPIFLK